MAKPSIDVCLSPLLLTNYSIEGKIVVVIDVLRATSTICTALGNGAEKIIPVPDIDAAMRFKDSGHIIAAERQGQKVEGFKFGNSPFEYTSEKVKGKTIVFTTTNGTRAIELSRAAEEIIIGSFINLNALSRYLKQQQKDVLLFCAGWKNNFNLEDTIFAGAVVEELQDDFDVKDDAALSALYLFRYTKNDLVAHMKKASHYQRLHELGIDNDVEYCFTGEEMDVVPALNGDALVLI